MEYDSAM